MEAGTVVLAVRHPDHLGSLAFATLVPHYEAMSTPMRISAFANHYNTVLEDAPDEEIVLERTGGKPPGVVTPMRLAEGDLHAVQVVTQVLRRALDDAVVSSRVVAGLAD